MKIISLSLGIREGHSVVATIWKMQATSVAPFSARCFPPNHNQLWGTIHHPQTSPHSSIKTKTKPTRTIILFSRGNQKCLATTSSLRREEKKKNKISGHVLLIEEMHYNKDQKRHSRSGISTNMWWQNLKGVLGQRLNLEGIVSSAAVVARERQLALPHLTVPDISWIDWAELQRRGFRGVIFDKDNTLTAPYSLSLWPPLAPSLDRCKSVFGDNIVVFSNSAGLYQYDADGSKAATLEKSLGIHVLRHGTKKPAGTAEEIEKYFGYTTSELVMVGDRHFTDIVYGNRNGFLTILTEPLSLAEEPFIVKQVRKLERCLVNHWYRRRIKPTDHILLLEAMQCVKDPSPL